MCINKSSKLFYLLEDEIQKTNHFKKRLEKTKVNLY